MKAREIALACVTAAACVPATATTPQQQAFNELAARCAPDIHPDTLRKMATVESTGNPFAVSNWDEQPPRNKKEALQVIDKMLARGAVFAVGVVQIHRDNVRRYGHTFESILEPCNNIRVGAQILKEGFVLSQAGDEQLRTREALSRYYSGNARRGFLPDKLGGTSYVQRVAASAGDVPAYVIPALRPHPSDAVAMPPQPQQAAEAPVKVRLTNPGVAPQRQAAAERPVQVQAATRVPVPTAREADPWMVTVGAPAAPVEPDAQPASDWMVTVSRRRP